ncbi:MAG: DM13 domain-containing protein [Cyanothece sp. SIO2G6]|nr:DM13 domain-containing protein [Cyanothece sp. SIO2G6]
MIRTLLNRCAVVGAVVLTSLTVSFPANADTEADVISSGSFTGVNNHAVTGSVTIVETETGTYAVLDPTFSLDNAPDPKLAFGKDGQYDAETLFHPLTSLTGAQMYLIPDDIDPEDYNEFWLWCERFNVGLGVAPIQE